MLPSFAPQQIHQDLQTSFQDFLKTIPVLQELQKPLNLPDFPFYNAQKIIVLGTGGSSLGGQALTAISPHSEKVIFLESIDASTFYQTLKGLSLEDVGIIAISKSGGTLETLAQVAALFPLCPNSCQWAVITDPKECLLRSWASSLGIACFDHPAVGGRFSVFTLTALWPVLASGFQVEEFYQGAQSLLTPKASEKALQAAASYQTLFEKGLTQTVLWFYGDALKPLGRWMAQLWGESLGKKDIKGNRLGITPIIAQGPYDQHSQLQLYLDGPLDKTYTLFYGQTPETHARPLYPDLFEGLFKNCTLQDLMKSHYKATLETLQAHHHPVRGIAMESLTPFKMGEIMMGFTLETLALAFLWGIDPLKQPAVEEGKKRALENLGKDK